MNQQAPDGRAMAQHDDSEIQRAINVLQKSFQERLCDTANGCKLHVYERYVQDLSELLRNCIEYCERDWKQMTLVYDKRIDNLLDDIEHLQHQSLEDKKTIEHFASIKIAEPVTDLSITSTTASSLNHIKEIEDFEEKIMNLNNEINKLRAENDELKALKIENEAENKNLKEEAKSLKSEWKKVEKERTESFNRMLNNYSEGDTGETQDFQNYCNERSKIHESKIAEYKVKMEKANEKRNREMFKQDLSDQMALILEIADLHDHTICLRAKCRQFEERVEQLELKVKFREKIIRGLRRSMQSQSQTINKFTNYLHEHVIRSQKRCKHEAATTKIIIQPNVSRSKKREPRRNADEDDSSKSVNETMREETTRRINELLGELDEISDIEEIFN